MKLTHISNNELVVDRLTTFAHHRSFVRQPIESYTWGPKSMKTKSLLALPLIAATLALASCGVGGDAETRDSIRAVGSSTVFPVRQGGR